MLTQKCMRAAMNACVVAGMVAASGCKIKPEWSHFRYSGVRQGDQYFEKDLFKPAKVSTLHPGWAAPFHPSGAGFFTSSPVVYKDRVYIGNSNGHFYAINASTGAQVWQFPVGAAPPFKFTIPLQPSSNGIASSAAIASVNGTEAVTGHLIDLPEASARWAPLRLNAHTGALILGSRLLWHRSRERPCSTSELHEQIGYSAPLVWLVLCISASPIIAATHSR